MAYFNFLTYSNLHIEWKCTEKLCPKINYKKTLKLIDEAFGDELSQVFKNVKPDSHFLPF